MRLLIQAGIIAGTLAAAPSALAQALPDSVRSAGVTVSQWQSVQAEVRRAAAARGASERALAAVAARVSTNLVQGGRIDLDQLLHSIDERARQLAELQSQLAAMERADDPGVATLLGQARTAIDAGDLTGADEFLAQAAQSDLAAIARDEARTSERRSRAAETIGERGRLAFLSANYLVSAAHYSLAATTAPQGDRANQWYYRAAQATALQEQAQTFGDMDALRAAAQFWESNVLPLAPRDSEPGQWAVTQRHLGTALFELGNRGDQQAMLRAVEAYQAAATVLTRESSPSDWAEIQNDLGAAFMTISRLWDPTKNSEAIRAYQLALQVRPVGTPDWADTQINIGNWYLQSVRGGDLGAAANALESYQNALSVYSGESDPQRWAAIQNSMGNLWATIGDNHPSGLLQAIEAYQAALEVRTRERTPMEWAQLQNNLGLVFVRLGEQGSPIYLEQAREAFRAALLELTRERSPLAWATEQYNLARVLTFSVRLGQRENLQDALSAIDSAIAGFEEVGASEQLERARQLKQQLLQAP